MMLVKGRGVAVQPALILQPALDKVEGDLGQPPLRHAVQIFDIDGVFHSHRAGFSLKSATLAGVSGQSYRVSPRFSTIRNSAGLTCTPGHNRDLYGPTAAHPGPLPAGGERDRVRGDGWRGLSRGQPSVAGRTGLLPGTVGRPHRIGRA